MLIVTACSNVDLKEHPSPKLISEDNKNIVANNAIKLERFSKIPDEIDGGACFFYLSDDDMNKQMYIFVNDLAETAFISIKGKILKFKLDKFDGDKNTYYYSFMDYKLTLVIDKIKNEHEEESVLNGKIKLEVKDKVEFESVFIGTCGC